MPTPTAQQPESVLSSAPESGMEVTEDSLGLDEGQTLDSTLKTLSYFSPLAGLLSDLA
jgi:hypothetical protein